MLAPDPANLVRVGATGRMPHVAQLAGAPDRPCGAAPDPDLRLPRRPRLEGRVAERPVVAVEAPFAAPEGAHDPDLLVCAAAAPGELDAHEVVLVLVPAHADAERGAAAGELLERRDLFREMHRVVQRDEDDRRA